MKSQIWPLNTDKTSSNDLITGVLRLSTWVTICQENSDGNELLNIAGRGCWAFTRMKDTPLLINCVNKDST